VSLPPNGPPDGPHATFWQKSGEPISIGTLPDGVTTMPTAINNRGDVAGNVHLSDGSIHPFLWDRQTGKMQDLSVASGDFVTIVPCCGTLNNRGGIVAFSCGSNGCRAVVRQGDEWVDLNTLVVPGTTMYLANASSINDAGEIAGFGITVTGEVHAFRASPSPRQ
jgi:hypothetical protein